MPGKAAPAACRRCRCSSPLPRHGTADDHIGLVLVVLGLSDADGGVEIVVRQMRIEDFVTVTT